MPDLPAGVASITMLHRVRQTIEAHGLIAPRSLLLVAVSGGADSIALLHALIELRDAFDFSVGVAHLDHGLRGEEGRADALFVQELAANLGLECAVEMTDVRTLSAQRGISLEMAARDARYRFLKTAAAAMSAHAVATGHTLDDQAETLILRLARGAGTRGLGGIAHRAVINGLGVVRPLRDVRREDVLRFLRERGVTWREDVSNRDLSFLRNRVRHELLPLMRERLNPRILEALVRTADVLGADEAWLEEVTEAAARGVIGEDDPPTIDTVQLGGRPLAARRRILRQWLVLRGADPDELDYGTIERLLALADADEGSARLSIPGGGAVERAYRRLAYRPEGATEPAAFDEIVRIPGETLLSDAGYRVITRVTAGVDLFPGNGIGRFPAGASFSMNKTKGSDVHIRTWRPGDRFELAGGAGTKKIQDIFTDAKVPRFARPLVPLLVCRDRVIWVPGYQVAGPWHVESPKAPAVRVRVEKY